MRLSSVGSLPLAKNALHSGLLCYIIPRIYTHAYRGIEESVSRMLELPCYDMQAHSTELNWLLSDVILCGVFPGVLQSAKIVSHRCHCIVRWPTHYLWANPIGARPFATSPRRRYDVGPRHAPTNFPEMSQPVKRGAICGLAECPVGHRHGSAGMITSAVKTIPKRQP